MTRWTYFVRFHCYASSETDSLLHIFTVRQIIHYFAASDHLHYLRYSLVYLMKMKKQPENLLNKFLADEDAMRHQN